jgi:hypothetical protein
MPVRAVLIPYRKPGLSLDQFKTSCENHVKLIRHLVKDDAAPLSHRRSYIARKESAITKATKANTVVQQQQQQQQQQRKITPK